MRHGANRNPADESTALASCLGSEFDKTTLTHPNQRTLAAYATQDSIPEQVVICGVIADNLEQRSKLYDGFETMMSVQTSITIILTISAAAN